jgi:hypothetical protein
MPSFIVVRFSLFVVIFHVVFEVSLLVDVRLRGSSSARSAIPNRVSREQGLYTVPPPNTTRLRPAQIR